MFGSQHKLLGLCLIGFASAACQLSNHIESPPPDLYNNEKLCVPQGEGDWTFSMYSSAIEVPTFDGDNPNAGYVSTNAFLIYDNTCTLRGEYAPEGNDCGIPYTIEENFLQQVLTIKSVDKTPGAKDAYFQFDYGNGEFSIGNNGCTCGDLSSGLQAASGCKCAFPVSGVL